MVFLKYVLKEVVTSIAMRGAYALTIVGVIFGCLASMTVLIPVAIGAVFITIWTVFWTIVFGLSREAREDFARKSSSMCAAP